MKYQYQITEIEKDVYGPGGDLVSFTYDGLPFRVDFLNGHWSGEVYFTADDCDFDWYAVGDNAPDQDTAIQSAIKDYEKNLKNKG